MIILHFNNSRENNIKSARMRKKWAFFVKFFFKVLFFSVIPLVDAVDDSSGVEVEEDD